eukprot:5507048-Pleurochrysis_carterae.AAC.1
MVAKCCLASSQLAAERQLVVAALQGVVVSAAVKGSSAPPLCNFRTSDLRREYGYKPPVKNVADLKPRSDN